MEVEEENINYFQWLTKCIPVDLAVFRTWMAMLHCD